ncbi:MAG: DUF4399 domain-containing protein [Pseudomonadota bacterium]
MKATIAVSAITALALSFAAPGALAEGTPSPEGAEVYFVNLSDGDTVTSPVTIIFGMRNMGIAPAGVEKEKTGHHHLIINEAIEGEELEYSIPADDQHVHFGGGQTEATLDLPAGTHVLQLVAADHNHVPHDPPVMSERITITVE